MLKTKKFTEHPAFLKTKKLIQYPLILKFGNELWFTSSLFANNEEGVDYQPYKISTLFQDSNGDVSVTSPGDSVGRVEDQSGNNNHAIQSIEASKPIYGIMPKDGIRNLLIHTEKLDNTSYWDQYGVTINEVSESLPDIGSEKAFTIDFDAGSSNNRLEQIVNIDGDNTYTWSFWAKSNVNTTENIRIEINITGNDSSVNNINEISITSDWTRFSITATATDHNSINCRFTALSVVANSVTVNAPMLEISSFVSNYQKVGNQFDVTEKDVQTLSYLYFDGVDDYLETSSIDFSNVDESSVCIGQQKLNSSDSSVLVEFSKDSDNASNSGVFVMMAPGSNDDGYLWQHRGSI